MVILGVLFQQYCSWSPFSCFLISNDILHYLRQQEGAKMNLKEVSNEELIKEVRRRKMYILSEGLHELWDNPEDERWNDEQK